MAKSTLEKENYRKKVVKWISITVLSVVLILAIGIVTHWQYWGVPAFIKAHTYGNSDTAAIDSISLKKEALKEKLKEPYNPPSKKQALIDQNEKLHKANGELSVDNLTLKEENEKLKKQLESKTITINQPAPDTVSNDAIVKVVTKYIKPLADKVDTLGTRVTALENRKPKKKLYHKYIVKKKKNPVCDCLDSDN